MTATTARLTGVHSIVLFCLDTEAARRWYEAVGFEYLRGYDGMHWFRLGDAEIMIHPDNIGPGGHAPVLHAAVADVDALFRHVVAQGLRPHDHQQTGGMLDGPVTRPWGHREFELDDPAGNCWAFTQSQAVVG
jgi:catechol 2,3-dioxygenase-like lactoylglutathione lyase family enzyme